MSSSFLAASEHPLTGAYGQFRGYQKKDILQGILMASNSNYGKFGHNFLPKSRKESEDMDRAYQTELVRGSLLAESPVRSSEDNNQSMQVLNDHMNRHFEKIRIETSKVPDFEAPAT